MRGNSVPVSYRNTLGVFTVLPTWINKKMEILFYPSQKAKQPPPWQTQGDFFNVSIGCFNPHDRGRFPRTENLFSVLGSKWRPVLAGIPRFPQTTNFFSSGELWGRTDRLIFNRWDAGTLGVSTDRCGKGLDRGQQRFLPGGRPLPEGKPPCLYLEGSPKPASMRIKTARKVFPSSLLW